MDENPKPRQKFEKGHQRRQIKSMILHSIADQTTFSTISDWFNVRLTLTTHKFVLKSQENWLKFHCIEINTASIADRP